MTESDIVVIDITSVNENACDASGNVDDNEKFVECPMCGNDIKKKNIKNTCRNKIEGHDICYVCSISIEECYYKNGIGCLYCGDPKTINDRKENIMIVRTQQPRPLSHVVVVEQGNIQTRSDMDYTTAFCSISWVICITFCGAALIYVAGNIAFSIGQNIGHWIDNEEHTHRVEFSFEKGVIGIFGWASVAYCCTILFIILDENLHIKSLCKCNRSQSSNSPRVADLSE